MCVRVCVCMYVLSGCISDAEKLIIDESTRPTCVLLQMAEIEFYFFEMPPIIILLDDDDNDNNARIKQNGQSNYCADINGTVVGFLALVRIIQRERKKSFFLSTCSSSRQSTQRRGIKYTKRHPKRLTSCR